METQAMAVDNIDFQSLERALASLCAALDPPPRNDRERDGAVQRYEYTFDLSWKFIRRLLLKMGRTNVSSSPKPLFRDAHSERFIDDVDLWFEFLEARNATAHIYNLDEAERVFKIAAKFPEECKALLNRLKDANKNSG